MCDAFLFHGWLAAATDFDSRRHVSRTIETLANQNEVFKKASISSQQAIVLSKLLSILVPSSLNWGSPFDN